MTRPTFVTITSFIALTVGLFALTLPATLMAAKGVSADAAASVWVREVGALLMALGVMGFLIRSEPDSRAMRAFLAGNAVVHAGLLPVEMVAYGAGVITRLEGVVPNTVLHVALAGGFVYFAARTKVDRKAAA